MKKPIAYLTLDECKTQASILLKSLYTEDEPTKQAALKRFARCPESTNLSPDHLKRKHALAVIAFENDFGSWATLKLQISLIKGGFLNHWFSDYDEAKAYQKMHGGFLLPYKKQFFICEAAYIAALGLNPNDPNWAVINYDGTNPENTKIFRRLCHV